ncbi:hypothetical protein J2785_001273 [Burkholderia ambifaria]|uniref:hypothetical protein n=1 Tax=Burkholderia pyrrocinia TaxID=60550 RepID=UPI00158C8B67|nr:MULTISPECIES: hypothetical protein [Burkholderia cepacia complex]MDR6498130.1 hypothetical protein [Burkholderia ambifaria]
MASLLDWQLDIWRRLDLGLPNTPVYLEGVSETRKSGKIPALFTRGEVAFRT